MTPMIDCVFQLLIFLMLTLKIAAPEGDFNVKMPAQGAHGAWPDSGPCPPSRFASWPRKRPDRRDEIRRCPRQGLAGTANQVREIVGDAPGPGTLENTEIEFDCDYNLRYEYGIQAMTAVSATSADGHVVKLVEKISYPTP